jgi:nitrate reductase NapE component
MKTMKCLSSSVILLVLLISMLNAYAQDSPEYELNLIYNGQNLSFGDFSRETPPGQYKVEVLSLSGEVLETSGFDIAEGWPTQTFKVIVPYSKEGMLLNIYDENGTLMFYTDVSQYAEEYPNISDEEKKAKIQSIVQKIVSSNANETQMKEVEKRYEETKKWFTLLLIAAVLIVGAMVFYVWRYKMPRE